jgi:tripeptidyl-peptidase-1
MSPSDNDFTIVTDYIWSFGVTEMTHSSFKDLITVTMPVKVANKMFNTEFAQFQSLIRQELSVFRVTKPYFLPSEVASRVAIVDDVVRLPAIRQSPRIFGAESTADDEFSSCGRSCNGMTTPDVLQKRHGYRTLKSAAPGNSMSVAEFQLQYYDNQDLKSFSNACGVNAAVDVTVGGNNENICLHGGCVEALLDIEYIEAVANPIPLTVIYLSTFSLLDWVNQVLAMPNAPLVHSVSYGNDEVQQTSVEYMNSVNDQFLAAGLKGLSILFASGDQGVWGRSGVGKTFHPDFPAASPYVTAVGGTDFATKSTIGDETTWSCGGGGFSDTFGIPSWQASQVSNYLATAASQNVLPSSSYFNSSGRAYPDIAALGGQVNPYCVAIKGDSFGGVAGTSASCPVAAGIFAQLNDARLAAGKSALGFLNPLIYSHPECFFDVKDGSQNNCNAGTTGFSALPGWDPATGNGTPDYACLEKVVLAMA